MAAKALCLLCVHLGSRDGTKSSCHACEVIIISNSHCRSFWVIPVYRIEKVIVV